MDVNADKLRSDLVGWLKDATADAAAPCAIGAAQGRRAHAKRKARAHLPPHTGTLLAAFDIVIVWLILKTRGGVAGPLSGTWATAYAPRPRAGADLAV
jgi:hypothetical protein